MKSYPTVLKSLLNNEVPANATQENYEHFAQLLELHNSGLVEGTLHKSLSGSAILNAKITVAGMEQLSVLRQRKLKPVFFTLGWCAGVASSVVGQWIFSCL